MSFECGAAVQGKRHLEMKNVPPEVDSGGVERMSRHNQVSILTRKLKKSWSPMSSLPNPKPEKVKSRWTRNSELEFGHGTENHNGDGRPADSPSTSTSHSPLSQNTSANILRPETESIPKYDHLDENIYLFERKKNKSKKEMRRMVCNCILTKEERQRGVSGCLDDCLNRMLMIECGSRCLLGDHCANKRFQKKQFAKVEPFQTLKKGWGLRALQLIQPGQFIVEYVGEVLDPREFKQRVKRYSKENREHFYFMALKSDEIIDATVKGNLTRFINHSCDPNGETQKWTVNGELRIGFFAKRSIEIGEEITFDYQFQRYGKKAQKCFCESPNCRGFIGSTETPDINIDGSLSLKYKQDSDEKTLEEEFEDLGLDEEIAKLTAGGGLRNRQQTLMLARLMVRAEDSANRHKLLDILKGTQEMAYLRLFLDYHGLELLWSWSYDLDDVYLKGDILETLAILPIPHRTALKDSKVLDVVEKWSKPTENGATPSKDNLSISAQLPLVVEPTSASSPTLEVSIKREEREDELDDPPGKDVKAEVIENGVLDNSSKSNDSDAQKNSLVDEEASNLAKLSDEVKLSPDESQNTVKISEETRTSEPQPAASVDVQVEIELGSEIEIKPELNGVAESETKPSGEGTESQNSDTSNTKITEVAKIRNARSASSSSASTLSGETTPVIATPTTGDKVIGRRISVKSRNESKDDNKENKVKTVTKPLPDIVRLACKLLYMWKDLKEGFRIPRLERQKRLEDEKEADRKAIEMEERRAKGLPPTSEVDSKRGGDNSRNNALANILGLRKKLKRPQDEKKPLDNVVNSSFHTPNSVSSAPNNDSTGPTPPKMYKEAHRMQFEMDLMRKQYEEALNNYHKQMEQYNAMFHQQSQPQMAAHGLQPNVPQLLNSQQQNMDMSHPSGPNLHQSPFKQGSTFGPVTTGAGPPQPPPPPPPLASMYGEQSIYQGYQMGHDYPGGTPVVPAYPPIAGFNDHLHPSLPAGSPHINHVNNSISTTSNSLLDEDRSKRKDSYDNNLAFSVNSGNRSSPQYVNPVLIECTNSQDHNFMSDDKAVIQTDYGVEYVPIKSENKKSSNSKSTNINSSNFKENLFNAVYPAPGTYYMTKEGSCYFIPPLLDSRGTRVPLNIFENIPQPYPPSLTKEMISTALPPNWRSAKDKEGNNYYYNRLTKTVQWELPSINMSSLADESGTLKSKESVVVSNADSTSTPRDESLPRPSNCIAIIPISTAATTTAASATTTTSTIATTTATTTAPTNVIRTPSTPLPSEDTSPHISPEEPPLVNGESTTLDEAINEDSNECSGTPSHTLPGSCEPDPLITKPHINNINDHSNNSILKNCSSILEINDGELIAANRRSRNDKTEKRIKDRFKAEMSEHVKYCLNPYRKPDCSIGRILSNDHFKYVARKLTHFVMVKELKHCRNIEDLSCSETVKHKAKDYVKKYMAKQGPIYRPESLDEERKLSPKEITQESVNDHSVDIYASDQ